MYQYQYENQDPLYASELPDVFKEATSGYIMDWIVEFDKQLEKPNPETSCEIFIINKFIEYIEQEYRKGPDEEDYECIC